MHLAGSKTFCKVSNCNLIQVFHRQIAKFIEVVKTFRLVLINNNNIELSPFQQILETVSLDMSHE